MLVDIVFWFESKLNNSKRFVHLTATHLARLRGLSGFLSKITHNSQVRS